ncbi:MAG TPA: ABC transporter ATP-binding protein [Nocardioidaceae bacterium]|nr:ABC transporter ATP-binding protein [Nocardioidaceae bacterium]
MGDAPPVVLSGLGKRFGRTVALEAVDLVLEPGEIFGYLGPNGAGKTTTLRVIMGLLRPTAGTASVLGLDSWRQAGQVHRLVGYVPGEPALYPRLTGRQHLEYVGHLRGLRHDLGGAATASRLDLDLDRPAGALSRGNRQKLAIMLALLGEPALLVLDEPSSGLDPLVQQEFQTMLREHVAAGGSVLLSSHVLGEVQRMADRIGVLRQGRLVAVERLPELQAKSLHRVRATFAAPVRAEEFASLDGALDVQVDGPTLTCKAPQTALDAVLKAVARHPVVDFECAETELEEMFLTYYGGQGAGRAE